MPPCFVYKCTTYNVENELFHIVFITVQQCASLEKSVHFSSRMCNVYCFIPAYKETALCTLTSQPGSVWDAALNVATTATPRKCRSFHQWTSAILRAPWRHCVQYGVRAVSVAWLWWTHSRFARLFKTNLRNWIFLSRSTCKGGIRWWCLETRCRLNLQLNSGALTLAW